MNQSRLNYLNFISKNVVGPTPDNGGDLQEKISLDPKTAYLTGVLFPRLTGQTDGDSIVSDDGSLDVDKSDLNMLSEEIEEDVINLSNAYKESAMSVTVCLRKNIDSIDINITFGTYKRETTNGEIKYAREHHSHSFTFTEEELQTRKEKYFVLEKNDDGTNSLILRYFIRKSYVSKNDLFTFSVINETDSSNGKHFFQTEINLKSNNPAGFEPIPLFAKNIRSDDSSFEDDMNNRLLYRKIREYAVGHGCSPMWDDKSESKIVTSIKCTSLPYYELAAVVPVNFEDISLDMLEMCKKNNSAFIFNTSLKLCEKYEEWIQNLELSIPTIEDPKLQEYATNYNLVYCKECLKRMRNGIKILQENSNALEAFRLMNEAMLEQMVRSRLDVADLEVIPGQDKYQIKDNELREKFKNLDINDRDTWGDGNEWIGYWRPFQFAFILINISSIVDPNCDERENLELIWFPTGGGKTEAYLGLSAFTIFWKRINKTDDGTCTQILMRYTLRMLTAQQFSRASALICACERLRKENEALLGKERITIGLWVGSDSTPNSHKDAGSQLQSMKKNTPNNFVITKCPHCGAIMGKVESNGVLGYRYNSSKKKFTFVCDNKDCVFSKTDNPIPLTVIDQEIYEKPPTLVIATVDKLATIPFSLEKIKKMFGLEDGPKTNRNHLELIIQDELHLISGPLGSTVGIYETLIDTLCSYEVDENGNSKMVRPKIIASTATISRAKKQCHDLFAVDTKRVKLFPPSGINPNENFFSKEDNNQNGRVYIGYIGYGAQSPTSASISLLSNIEIAKDKFDKILNTKDEKDAYHTNVCYFNSIRELGLAATWIHADIPEKILTLSGQKTSYLSYIELNSRVLEGNITKSFEKLGKSVNEKGFGAIDICLATNMISVGLDISRLGLMTVFGQPKTTSEYIQTTSRVGREYKKRPGIVFTIYNPAKPRDKSVYEQFQTYHSKLYSYVEPTSVSPFSSALMSKAIAAIFCSLVKTVDKNKYTSLNSTLTVYKNLAKNLILERVKIIDSSELKECEEIINEIIFNLENNYKADIVGTYKKTDKATWLYPNSKEKDDFQNSAYSAPTSMRSVDSECNISIITERNDE